MRELINEVKAWGYDRGLIFGEPERQVLKAMSELGEFADEVLKGDVVKAELELGDVLVTLILAAANMDLDIEYALELAYNKINARKGNTVNGVFIKQEE